MARGYSQPGPGRLVRDDGRVEAVRYYQTEGARFSGWIVREPGDPYAYSDPIPNKPEAIEVLLAWEVQ
jgi:hypothetical protein